MQISFATMEVSLRVEKSFGKIKFKKVWPWVTLKSQFCKQLSKNQKISYIVGILRTKPCERKGKQVLL